MNQNVNEWKQINQIEPQKILSNQMRGILTEGEDSIQFTSLYKQV
jgi:hypothetical protein